MNKLTINWLYYLLSYMQIRHVGISCNTYMYSYMIYKNILTVYYTNIEQYQKLIIYYLIPDIKYLVICFVTNF